MPVQLPISHHRNNYMLVCGLDNDEPKPWLRVMLFEGQFNKRQAHTFFNIHDGCRNTVPMVPVEFRGPVEIFCMNIDPASYEKKLRSTTKLFNTLQPGYMNPYDWKIAKFAIQSLYPEIQRWSYVAHNPWWVT